MATKRKAPVKKAAPALTKVQTVKKILKQMEVKLSREDAKATLGDYIRLVQFEKELEEDEPREIKVTWVEPATKSESEA